MFKEWQAGPPLLRLIYIAETLINPLFTDVVFRRDSEGDVSGHYESGGVMPPNPPPPVTSAPLVEMWLSACALNKAREYSFELSRVFCLNALNSFECLNWQGLKTRANDKLMSTVQSVFLGWSQAVGWDRGGGGFASLSCGLL